MSTTDVECFQGKIFYNSDCSAVIIDPNEQNAKDEKKNNQTQPPPPIIHTFRVVTASDVEKNSDLQKTIPQKPILMCFICKLSFGNVQIFQQHSNSEHGVHLQKTEQVLLAREFSSAIIQRNGQESPQISFLEPIVMEDNKDENTAVTTVASNFLSLAAISNIFQYSHQKPALGVCQEHGNVKGNDCKTCELGGLRTSPPSSASSFTIGACPEHVSGRPLGVECSRCELILSTSRLTTNAQTMSSTRNSCKTLKCPQCNWHYKYQETLEIHMREKHPDGESACGYCLAAQPHPRLARGESYTCGYKPYRCEICNYSTTTKGNLSIHMQSDKHLNNMQELNTSQNINLNLNGPSTQNIPQPPPPPVSSVVSQSSTATPVSSQTPNKPKPNFRCDVCSYETSVARNLRIHMTSEKHTHNISVLQSNMKHFQTLNMIQQQQQHQLSNILPENFGGSGLLPEAAIADMAYNQAIMLQLLQSSNQRNNEHIEISEAEQGLNPDTLEPPFTLDLNPLNIFTCLICESFHTHSLEDLNNHLLTDRSRPQTPNTNDIMLVMNNNYICRLCSYKTNLKANYQLHSKTDKHLQKLNYINHIKEGGSRTEHKLNFPNSTTVQLKCNACEFYTNSMQKLTMHCGNGKHEKLEDVLKYLINRISNEQSFVNIFCKICDFTSENVIGLMRHLRSGVHTTENFDEISKIVELHLEEKQTEPTIEKNDSLTSSLQIDISTENGSAEEDIVDIVLKCNNCEYFASTKPEMEAHIDNYHENCSENYYLSIPTNPGALKAFHAALAFAAVAAQTSPTPKKPKIDKKFLCPLCESAFCQKAELEEHLVTIHSVNNSESVNRLLKMLEENSHSISSSHIVSEKHVYKYRCKQCSLAFKTEEKLTNHSLYHTMRDATKCFICHRTFRSTLSLQKHMESHDKEQEAGILEDEPLLEAPNPNDNEISSSVEASTSTPSILSSNIPQQQLSQTNSTTFNQTQPQLDVLSLMHFHHQLMSLNFMNLAPPLSFGPSHLSSNNTLSNNSDLGAVNLAKPVLPASTDSSEHLLPNIQQGNNQKRARTRITDDQLKILRAHFDINNSPSEESILEMSKKANLPMKVVKHWFRNTLFKERQRNKDSPYNFANPPSTTLNLEEYERTGQTSTNLSQKSPTIIDESINNSRSQPQPPPDFAMVSLNEQEPDNSSSSLDLQIKVEPIEHEFPANSSETENRSESECSEREIISRPQTPGFGDFLGPENFHQMGPPKKFSGSNSSSNSPAGGKRANRTRFTDYQIKVLQEFFENNSYPKDSDLEYLSKLLLLSPRVIVVWFQNARQKQRKIYENQPNSTFYENDEKKSTNINYTCKKCNLIFQRYYELIRHQKNHCFKEENNKKSAKAKIAAAQVAQSLSSEDSNSSAVDVSCDETIDLSQPSRKRKLSENAGESRYDFLYNYYLKNSVGSSSGGVGDKTLEFLIQFYQFNESKKFFHLDASPHLERTPSPQPQQQQNVIPPPPPQNIIQAPQISNTPNSSISSSQDFYESPMSSPTTIETTISVVEGGQGHNQNQAIQLSQPQINNHKRLRTTILPDQLNLLYECYQTESNPSRKMLEEISKKVNLKKRVVQVWFQNARAKDKKSRNNRFADETSVNQNLNSNITVSSTPPANMALVRELMTNTKDKCMVNGVFNHFFFNVPQAAATNSSEEELEGDDHKIEEKPNKQNSSVYPYYNNYENRTEAGSIY